jgi:signal transduction histidine kinase
VREAFDATRPLVEMFAYGPDFVSANARAPAFPLHLQRALEAGQTQADESEVLNGQNITTVALRMTWNEGPAAIVIAKRIEPAQSALSDAWPLAALVSLLLGAVVLSAGPIVRRVRRLDLSVRRSAAARYREPVAVEGSDEIAELAQAFNAAGADIRAQIDEVERRERGLRNFVENTTHDVMLPLTVLQGHLTRLRNELARGEAGDKETVRESLEESHYIASIVQNLGAAAKLEAGEPELRHDPFSWNAMVERVVLRHTTIAAQRGVELDYAVPESDVRAAGDVTLVEQALSNVVHNAVRYNKRGGHVAILLESRDSRFTVRVFDDGPGVPDAELTRLSERAYRSDAARARHPDGMGLGLSIAKGVADRHAFDFKLRRSEAGGLEVEFGGAALDQNSDAT